MTKRMALLVLTTILLLLGTGCVPGWLAASGGLGFLLGRATAPVITTQECFLNGEPVDCSALR